MREIMKIYDIDYCFHLAAEPYIPKGYQYPEKMFQTNTIGTLRVLEACKIAKVKKIIYYSTSEVYGTAQHLPMHACKFAKVTIKKERDKKREKKNTYYAD